MFLPAKLQQALIRGKMHQVGGLQYKDYRDNLIIQDVGGKFRLVLLITNATDAVARLLLVEGTYEIEYVSVTMTHVS